MARKEKKTKAKIDFSALAHKLGSQFQGLDYKNPASFPLLPRYALLLVVAIAVLAALWFVWLKGLKDQLDNSRQQETKLRQDYIEKVQKAASLPMLEEQKKEVAKYVDSLEKQLPGKSEMDALLSDLNQAGQERHLQLDEFKPGAVVLKQYYAELPISLKITGRYHDIGAFAADVAALSRIVTLNQVNLIPSPKKNTNDLILTATARTFRYLDPEEIKTSKPKGGKK